MNQYKSSVSTSLHNGLLSFLIALSITFLTPSIYLKKCFKKSLLYEVTGRPYLCSLNICVIFSGWLATYIYHYLYSSTLQKFIYLIYTPFCEAIYIGWAHYKMPEYKRVELVVNVLQDYWNLILLTKAMQANKEANKAVKDLGDGLNQAKLPCEIVRVLGFNG